MEVLPTHNFQPDLIVAGLRLGEPVIAFTGLLVTLVCFLAWRRLGEVSAPDDALRLSRIFQLLMAISTFIGAVVGHLFLYRLPFEFKMPGWILGMVAVSALEQASIERAKPFIKPGWKRALGWANMVALTLAIWFVSSTLWFPTVEIHAALGLLGIVVPLEAYLLLKHGRRGSRHILWGILWLVVAVGVHMSKYSLGPWFCFFDLSHLCMCAAFWQIMCGALPTDNTPSNVNLVSE